MSAVGQPADKVELHMDPMQNTVQLLACTLEIGKHLAAFANKEALEQDKTFDCGSLSFDVEQGLICAGICFVYKKVRRQTNGDKKKMATNKYYQLFDEFRYSERTDGIYARTSIEDTSLHGVAGFILEVLQRGSFSPLDFVMSLFYFSEVLQKAELELHSNIWRLLFVTTLLLADKTWEDKSVKTSDFIGAFPVVTNSQMVEMELAILTLMSFNLHVSVAVFRKWMNTLSEEELQLQIGSLVQNSEYIHTLRHELISGPLAQQLQASPISKQSEPSSPDFVSARLNTRQTMGSTGERMMVVRTQVTMLQHSPSQKQVRVSRSPSPNDSQDGRSPDHKNRTALEVNSTPAHTWRTTAQNSERCLMPQKSISQCSVGFAQPSKVLVEKTQRCVMAQRPKSQPWFGAIQKSRIQVERPQRCSMAQRPSSTPSGGVVQAKVKLPVASRGCTKAIPVVPEYGAVKTHVITSATSPSSSPSRSVSAFRHPLVEKQPTQITAGTSSSGQLIATGPNRVDRAGSIRPGLSSKVLTPRAPYQGTPLVLRGGAGTQSSDGLYQMQGGTGHSMPVREELGEDPSTMSLQEKRSFFESHTNPRSTVQGISKTTSAPSSFRPTVTQSSSGYPLARNSRATIHSMSFVGARPVIRQTTAATKSECPVVMRARSNSPIHVATNPPVAGRPINPLQSKQKPTAASVVWSAKR